LMLKLKLQGCTTALICTRPRMRRLAQAVGADVTRSSNLVDGLAQRSTTRSLRSQPLLASALRRQGARTASTAVASTISAAPVPLRPSSFRESQEQVSLSERQEAFLIERLPKEFSESHLYERLRGAGVNLGEDWRDRIFFMRSRLGISIGRAIVSFADHVPHVVQALPPGATYRPMDRNDVEAFVEQSERLVRLSDDLRRLARPENFLRLLTITEVPVTYGRKDVAHVINEHCGVVVRPQDIVFRFKRWGRQSDTCYVLCPDAQSVDHCVNRIQELAVPKRAAYGSLFGAAFLWSSRATLFLSSPSLDFLVQDDPRWVFTTGWQEDMQAEEFQNVMAQLKFFPLQVVKQTIEADRSAAFFMQFDDMSRTKRAMMRLRKLRWRWRVKKETPFFAYPRRVDVHRECEDGIYDDDASGGDSDIDEPVHY